jgi:hypothetical protein
MKISQREITLWGSHGLWLITQDSTKGGTTFPFTVTLNTALETRFSLEKKGNSPAGLHVREIHVRVEYIWPEISINCACELSEWVFLSWESSRNCHLVFTVVLLSSLSAFNEFCVTRSPLSLICSFNTQYWTFQAYWLTFYYVPFHGILRFQLSCLCPTHTSILNTLLVFLGYKSQQNKLV